MPKWAIAADISVAAAVAGVLFINALVSKYLRDRAVRELRRRFAGEVEFKSLRATLFPRVGISGENLVFRHRGRRDVPPLFEIRRFSAEAGLLALMIRRPRPVREIRLESLRVTIPPREHRPEERKESRPPEPHETPLVVDRIVADNAEVVMLPGDPRKEPLRFQVHRLTMREVGLDRPATFEAALTNPRPPGIIEVAGKFGPWQTEDPGQTPLAAGYTFRNADLGAFKGIAGILSSTGRFAGVLERLEVDGETDTPDFVVRRSRHPLALHTDFHAIVDGTNGDTLLEPVRARFLKSVVVARGGIVRAPGAAGRAVELNVAVTDARVEDMLRISIDADPPPMTGAVSFKTRFLLPPGEADITDRLRLEGNFGLAHGQFTSPEVREKVESLSRRGQGQPEDENAGSAISGLRGRFVLDNGVVRFSGLSFSVPGAAVLLNGSYSLDSQQLDFRGTLNLTAKVSQTTTGVKSFFLKLVDPLFKGKKAGAGSTIPIRVTGTRQHPQFGLDLGR